jgi:hypothetical protein
MPRSWQFRSVVGSPSIKKHVLSIAVLTVLLVPSGSLRAAPEVVTAGDPPWAVIASNPLSEAPQPPFPLDATCAACAAPAGSCSCSAVLESRGSGRAIGADLASPNRARVELDRVLGSSMSVRDGPSGTTRPGSIGRAPTGRRLRSHTSARRASSQMLD